MSRRNGLAVEDLRKTPSPSHGSIYSVEGSPSTSSVSILNGLNLLSRNLLTPTVSADDRMSPSRSLVNHIKREMGEGHSLVHHLNGSINMEERIPIPAAALQHPVVHKTTRPFKAYPHDPLSLAASFTATDGLLDSASAEKYNEFRKRMIEQIYAANGGQATVSNPKMRRTISVNKSPPTSCMENLSSTCSSADSTHSTPTKMSMSLATTHPMEGMMSDFQPVTDTMDDDKSECGKTVRDSAYYERRRKNNAAAKKSRDRRRIKEDEIAIRAAFLERENIELKFELATARKQLALYGIGRV